MPINRADRTYRVRQLPTRLELHQIPSFLSCASKKLGPAVHIRAYSVAHSLRAYERVATKTATIVFTRTPDIFDNDQGEWLVASEDPTWTHNLIFDVHFLGLTALSEPKSESNQVDCIAISGLASHAFGSWKQRGSHCNFMWLRDQLPHDMLNVRSIIYGYNTELVQSQSFQNLDHLALSLISSLRSTYSPAELPRSLILLAHSLGGIVLKRAIVIMANSMGGEDYLLKKIRTICLFGVPNQGMQMSHLLAMVQKQPNEQLVKTLSTESDELRMLDIQFSGLAVFRDIRFISVFETKRSRTTKEIAPGRWDRSGSYEILVDHLSAIQHGTRPLDLLPVDEDHSNIVKFSEDDPAYQSILVRLQDAILPVAVSVNTAMRTSDHIDEDHFKEAQKETLGLEEMINSLCLREANYRLGQIDPAFQNTFEWLYNDQSLKFIEWMQSYENFYWIRGKPGSGKSTLMKWLYNNPKTYDCTAMWHGKKVIRGWFFFYNRGSYLQKSFEGLLHSILHQVLREGEVLAKLILPEYLRRPPIERSKWSLRELERAFDIVLNQDQMPLLLYLFIDALDEYEGQSEMIADFLQSITRRRTEAMTTIKVCFSSRPWNIFLHYFNFAPGFSIHEHTKEDLRNYVSRRMTERRHIGKPLFPHDTCEHSEFQCLISTIVSKAHGVFLWVRLALDDLIRARVDGASLAELTKTILTLPEELGHFYDRIIQRLPGKYRLESYIMLEILVRADGQLGKRHFAAAVDCALSATFQDGFKALRNGSLSVSHVEDLSRRIESRCGGLVELSNAGGTFYVQFMHQTVKDFVSKPGFERRTLADYYPPTFQNGHSFLAKLYLTLLLEDLTRKSEHITPAMKHAQLSESTTGLSQRCFLESIPDNVFHCLMGSYVASVNSLMSFAVAADLRLFVGQKANLINRNPNIPLLHLLVRQASSPRIFEELAEAPSFGPMCRLLLRLGADKNAVWCNKTPFQTLLELSGNFDPECSEISLGVAEVFLETGENVEVDLELPELFEGGSCKPLHISHAKLAAELLAHGADVNALSSNGCTALDFLLQMRGRKSYRVDVRQKYVENAFEKAMFLLEHGGCITANGEPYLQCFIDAIQSIHDVPQKLRQPPHLPTPKRRGTRIPPADLSKTTIALRESVLVFPGPIASSIFP